MEATLYNSPTCGYGVMFGNQCDIKDAETKSLTLDPSDRDYLLDPSVQIDDIQARVKELMDL